MSLRQRLILLITSILLMFSINIAIDTWSNTTRAGILHQYQLAVNHHQWASNLIQMTDEIHHSLFQGHQQTSSDDIELIRRTTLRKIQNIGFDTQKLITSLEDNNSAASSPFSDSSKRLFNSWRQLYQQVDRLPTLTATNRELFFNNYQQFIAQLEALKHGQIQETSYQSVRLEKVEDLTGKISMAVFIISIIITIVLIVMLIRHTNAAFNVLKQGTVIVGSGKLSYRIPIENHDEFSEVAEAFNVMSAQLQQAVDEVNHAKEQADMASQAKSDFLANMSHELRTPLNAIIGYSEMMLEDLEAGPESLEDHKQDIDKILYAGRHLLSQINDVLDFSKIETGKMTVYREKFDCINVLKDVATTILPITQQGNNQIKIICENEMPPFYNDVTKFRQIFFNLLSNACKFTQDGEITVTAEYDNSGQLPLYLFVVEDNGIGMTVEQTSIVFEAFTQADYSTTRRFGGTGLGLALCKQFCDLMEGIISVESEINVGTRFTVEFPVDPIDLQQAERNLA